MKSTMVVVKLPASFMSMDALYMSSESGLGNELGFGWLGTDSLAPNPA